ncbi:MAG: GPR endopeptidase [Ruthenibacterium sp.]
MKKPYTDIAAELYAERRGTVPQGVKTHTAQAAEIHLTRVDILRHGLRRAKGCYITLDMPPFAHIDAQDETFVHAIASQLRALLPPQGTILVAGIGNRAVTPDALGPATADKIFVTQQNDAQGLPLRRVAAVSPGVTGATGLDTADVLRAIAAKLHPVAVLVVDSLCTATPARLGCSVQLSNAGLCPQSAQELTQRTLGLPVIAIGVPTVTQLAAHGTAQALLVTPKDIDAMIAHASSLLALAVNKALQPALSVGELTFLTS